MRHIKLLLIMITVATSISAQEKLFIHTEGRTNGAYIAQVDSIYFSPDRTTTYFKISDTVAAYTTAYIDSLTFGDNSSDIYIIYKNDKVEVINPLAFEGVDVYADGCHVTVRSVIDLQDINYHLSGSSPDGFFKIYSEKRYNLLLEGVSLHNPAGPAINIQSSKKSTVTLQDGSDNEISDGEQYADAPVGSNGKKEDQKATFFSEAKLVFTGNGNLAVTSLGNDQHAIAGDDEIEISSGNITIARSVKDGIHAKDGLTINGGVIRITSGGDGIDGDEAYVNINGGSIDISVSSADVKGIAADSIINVAGGDITLSVTGDQSKGFSCDRSVNLSGGSVSITNSGNAVLEASGSGFDPSYCTAIKADQAVKISGTTLIITTTGKGGKSISSDGDIVLTAGAVTITNSGSGEKYTNEDGVADAYVATCLSADGNILITGGTLITASNGAGGKAIKADGAVTIGDGLGSPVLNLSTSGSKILVSGSGNNAEYAEAKAVSVDGEIVIKSGTIQISSADDGIKSDSRITIDGGSVHITKSVEGIEAPFITINGGEIIVNASDDALNATHGNEGEGDDGSILRINDGTVVLSASGGDGLDSNGSLEINGGTTIVHGPPSSPEVGIDVNGSITVNGGILIASGTNSNMTEGPGNASAQYSFLARNNSGIAANTLFHVADAGGNGVVTFQPERKYYSIIFSSSALVAGGSYSIYTGGTSTGTNYHGLYTGGTYSGGTLKKTFTINGKLTNVSF